MGLLMWRCVELCPVISYVSTLQVVLRCLREAQSC